MSLHSSFLQGLVVISSIPLLRSSLRPVRAIPLAPALSRMRTPNFAAEPDGPGTTYSALALWICAIRGTTGKTVTRAGRNGEKFRGFVLRDALASRGLLRMRASFE